MNTLDIIIALPLVYFIYKGWKDGAIGQLAGLIGILLGCYAAVHFSHIVAGILPFEGESTILVAFFITFVAVVILSYMLGKIVGKILKSANLGIVDKVLGALIGMAKCLCILSIAIHFMILVDRSERVLTPTAKAESALFKPTYTVGHALTGKLETFVKEKTNRNNK